MSALYAECVGVHSRGELLIVSTFKDPAQPNVFDEMVKTAEKDKQKMASSSYLPQPGNGVAVV